MARFVLIWSLAVLLIGGILGCTDTSSDIWYTNLDQALIDGKNQGKPVFAMFYTITCPYCKKLMNQTLPDDNVKHYLKHFIKVKVDTRENPRAFARVAPPRSGVPYSAIINPGGEKIGEIRGFIPPQEMTKRLQAELYKMEIAYTIPSTSSAVLPSKTNPSTQPKPEEPPVVNPPVTPPPELPSDNPPTNDTNSTSNGEQALKTALNQAKAEGKQVMIDLFAEWCGFCKRMKQSTFPDPKVKKLTDEKYIRLTIDTQKEPLLAMRFGSVGLPTVIILDATGSEVDRIQGFRTPQQFFDDVKQIEEGKSSLSVARENYEKNKQNYRHAQNYLMNFLVARGMVNEAEKVYQEMKQIHGNNPEFEQLTIMYYMDIVTKGGAENALPILRRVCDNHPDHNMIFEICFSYALALYFSDSIAEGKKELKALSQDYPNYAPQIQQTVDQLESMFKDDA
jgi:pentatricopeptide repeat protein